MLTKPVFISVKNNKLVLAQKDDPLFKLDESKENLIEAGGDEDEALALFNGNLGYIKKENGIYWDGVPLTPDDLKNLNASEETINDESSS